MAGNKVSLVDVIGALNRLVPETKVGYGYTAGLLRVILEVSLNILVGMVADNLDGVLVCADGSVAAETPELALDGAFCSSVGSFFLVERKIGNIILDTYRELVLGRILGKFLVNRKNA